MKKKILMIMPFENIYPPRNGGMHRCFHVFHQLSKYFDVTAVTHTRKEDLLSGTASYPAIARASVYSTYDEIAPKDIFSFLPARTGNALKYRFIIKDLNRNTDSSFLKMYPILNKLLSRQQFDYIILENLQLTYYASWIRKYNSKAAIFFNAYNVESLLAQRNVNKTAAQQKEADDILQVEKNLYKIVDGIFCCSQVDLDIFTEMNREKIPLGYVLPNGIDTTLLTHSINISPEQLNNILFCGSLDYEPNKTGLLWFYKTVWPLVMQQLPGKVLCVVGRGNRQDYHDMLNDPTVNFIGEVEDVEPWYRKCNIAIAPLLNGSGTRFKILEAMSLGNPVVTTSIGIEGIESVNEIHALIADDAIKFANKIIQLTNHPGKSSLISSNARQLVETKYSWDIIGESLANYLAIAH